MLRAKAEKPAFTCSKLTVESLEKVVKYIIKFNNKDTRLGGQSQSFRLDTFLLKD